MPLARAIQFLYKDTHGFPYAPTVRDEKTFQLHFRTDEERDEARVERIKLSRVASVIGCQRLHTEITANLHFSEVSTIKSFVQFVAKCFNRDVEMGPNAPMGRYLKSVATRAVHALVHGDLDERLKGHSEKVSIYIKKDLLLEVLIDDFKARSA